MAMVYPSEEAERAMRAQILAALEELCRGMTLHDVREWYVDSIAEPGILGSSNPSAVD
jgi:hypothetical protein